MRLHFDLPLDGDLSAETWPLYLVKWAYCRAAMVAISNCDFRIGVVRHNRKDGFICFLVGESHRSRMLAIHEADPRGILYILEDNGSPLKDWEEKIEIKAVKAVTVGKLVSSRYTGIVRELELDNKKYHNNRLEHSTAAV